MNKLMKWNIFSKSEPHLEAVYNAFQISFLEMRLSPFALDAHVGF